MANDDVLIAVECKSKMTHDYVDQHVERKGKLKRMLPAYRHHQAFGAVAAMVMPTDVVHYAQNQGFYVLVQSGETLTICNDPSFSASAWYSRNQRQSKIKAATLGSPFERPAGA
ncbi:hypothetical protein Thiosp_00557 [Thiorhodovibrio litoralis]|nr:hypothetical protein Thiosp_00557 [Thiorhodovibrio litoralis]